MPTEQIKHWFLPLATFHIATAHVCNQFNDVFTLISLPHFKSINFYQNRSKIKLILQKNTKFLSAGIRPHTFRTAPLQISG